MEERPGRAEVKSLLNVAFDATSFKGERVLLKKLVCGFHRFGEGI